jgi:hypothetical protein
VAVPSPRAARTEIVPGGDSSSRTLEDEFRAEITAGRIPGIKLIQRRMGGSQDTAYKHQERLRALGSSAPQMTIRHLHLIDHRDTGLGMIPMSL